LFSFGLLCSSKRCLNLFERIQAYLCFRYFDHIVGNVYYFGLLARLFASLFLFLGWLVGCLVGWSIGWSV